MNALSLTSLTTSGTITTTLGSITSNYGMYNFNQPLYNGSTLAQIGTSQFTGNGRFDGALEVFGAFTANGNATFSGTTIQFITRPTFLTALSIGSAGIGNATGVPTISTLTLGNQAGKQGVIKLEDGSSSYPYGANYIQNIDRTLRFTGSDPTYSSSAFDIPLTCNYNLNVGSNGSYLYAGSNIMNTVQADTTTLSFTPTVASNSWQVITGLSCSGITTRRTTSKVRINITIGLCFCGTPATSLYFSIGKIQGGTTSYYIPSGLVGSGGSTYGLTAVQAVYGYGTVSFQYITNQSSAVGSVQYFVSTRIGSVNAFTSNPNIGFLSSGQTAGCAQIFCEELLC